MLEILGFTPHGTFWDLTPPTSGGGGSSSGGGGGGGGGGSSSGGGGGSSHSSGGSSGNANYKNQYIQYYLLQFGLKPNMKLVNKALKGYGGFKGPVNITLFQEMVRQQDKRYVQTDEYKQRVAGFMESYKMMFPGEPVSASFMKRVVLSGANASRFNQMIAEGNKFKQENPEFAASGVRLPQFIDFKNKQDLAYQNLLGRSGTHDERRMFFDAKMDPKDFEDNLRNVLTAQGSFGWQMGRELTADERNQALFNQPLAERIKGQLAAAATNKQSFSRQKTAAFDFSKEGGLIAQTGI